MAKRGQSLYDWVKENGREYLLEEWNYERNDKNPEEITYGSNKKAWWKCKKKHSYKASVYSRINGTNCPYCSNNKVLKGFNDLSTTHPDLAKQWHPTKNKLKPEEVTYGSHKKVWWKCRKGHEWRTEIYSRIKGSKCPYCSNRKMLKGYNDLKTRYPELSKEWDNQKNKIKPEEILFKSTKRVWWECKKNHKYKASINNRINGTNCPYCSNNKVLKGFNDLSTTHPDLAKQWHPTKNKLKPEEVTYGSHKKVWWKCDKNHEWMAIIKDRAAGKMICPECNKGLNTSFAEQYICYVLKNKFKDVENRKIINGHEYDIWIKDMNLLIEYDGYYYHKVIENKKKRELEKKKSAIKNGFDFINIEEVEEKVSKINIKNNTIKCNRMRRNIENLNIIIKLIISYINMKYNFNISNGIPSNARIKAIELSSRERHEESIEVLYPNLMKEWDYERNEQLEPSQITKGSRVKIWWKCKKGHKWKTTVFERIRGTNCPYCSNRKVLKGYNDLATTHPKIAKLWHPTKNKLKPYEIVAGSTKKIWWKCKKGHVYQRATQVITNTKKICPYCNDRKAWEGDNDLKTIRPDLCKKWDYKKNKITPQKVTTRSSKKVWWKCKKNHSYKVKVNKMVENNVKCPYCHNRKLLKKYNDLVTTYPKIAKLWHPTKNKLEPDEVLYVTRKNYWWKCEEGHEFEDSPYNVIRRKHKCKECWEEERKNKKN